MPTSARCSWLGILLAAAALAGCAAPATVEPPSWEEARATLAGPWLPDGTPAPLTSTMHDCYEHGGSFPVPASAYEGRLPDGFRVSPYTGFNTAPGEPSGETAELFVIASECSDGAGTPYRRAFVALFVVPPTDLVNPDAGFGHLFLLSYGTDAVAHADVWAAWGLGAEVQDVDLALDEAPAFRTSTAATSGPASLTLQTRVAGAPSEMASSMARFFHGDDQLRGIADAEFGALQALLGKATLTGSAEAGVWDGKASLDGVALHGWGHDNVWSYVPLPTSS